MDNNTLIILGGNALYTIILIAYINSQIKSIKELLSSEIKRIEDKINGMENSLKSEIKRIEDKITLVRLK